MNIYNTYYEILGNIDGNFELLFGSFNLDDCKSELELERDNWKSEGYKKLSIVLKKTSEKPSCEVYPEMPNNNNS